jgi:hypothetical protein
MPTYKVTPRNDHYCRHFAQVKVPTLLDESATPPSTSPDNGWFNLLSSFIPSPSSERPATPPSPTLPANRGGSTDGLWIYLFPNNGINCYSPAFYTIRVVPISVSRTILQYDIYARKGAPPSEVADFVTFLKEVEKEDFDLCEATQKGLSSGVYMMGQLHPVKENGVLCAFLGFLPLRLLLLFFS